MGIMSVSYTHLDFEYMHKAIESRVIGYVLKPFSSEEIGKQLEKAVKEIESRCQLETIEAKIQLLEQEDKNRALQDLIMGNPDGLALNEADYPVCLYARLVSCLLYTSRAADRACKRYGPGFRREYSAGKSGHRCVCRD